MDAQKQSLVHDFEGSGPVSSMNKSVIFALFLFILLGVGTGFIVSNLTGSTPLSPSSSSETITANGVEVKKGDVIGSDAKSFKDNAEGVLREGGIDGEGAFHLERSGGESQNVYLTSSVLDMTPFVGRKVKVWGETQAAQKAGWLMDVGRLQVLN